MKFYNKWKYYDLVFVLVSNLIVDVFVSSANIASIAFMSAAISVTLVSPLNYRRQQASCK